MANDDYTRLGPFNRGIAATSFFQDWQLSHTGNWLEAAFDRDGDTNYTSPEYNHTSTDTGYTDANELTKWGTAEPAYDAVGNMINDGEHYAYVYDVFGRLRKVLNRDTEALVAEYTYNGLNHRVGWHYDVTDDQGGGPDGTVDGDDPWYHFVYDERWRIVAVYRADTTTGDLDDDPKEQFIYHNAGLDGYGSGSYIDSVILRDRDANATGGWGGEADGTLEERRYYAQNWRHDVVAIITAAGVMAEQVRYSAYGVPFGLPQGDVDGDGDVDNDDRALINAAIGESVGDPGYAVRIDINLDGEITSRDYDLWNANNGTTLGWDALSEDPDDGVGNHKGYAGYEHDPALAVSWTLYHVRHRVYNADLGRWTRRDPLGYVDGMSLYAYVRGTPMILTDSHGLRSDDECVCGDEVCIARSATCSARIIAVTKPVGPNCHLLAPHHFWEIEWGLQEEACDSLQSSIHLDSCTQPACDCRKEVNIERQYTEIHERTRTIITDGCEFDVIFNVRLRIKVWTGKCGLKPIDRGPVLTKHGQVTYEDL